MLKQLQRAVRALVREEGANPTGAGAVTAWRFTGGRIRMPEGEGLFLYLVLDGALRLHTPSGMLDYAPGQYSLSRVDTPLSATVLTPSAQGDFLALSIELSAHAVIETVLALDDALTGQVMAGQREEAAMVQADRALLEAVYRLLSAMDKPALHSQFLQGTMLQEVIYYLLCGSCGRQLVESLARVGQADEIYQANRWIKENFRRPFTVEQLAERQNMSVSLFHQKFKSAVGMGPLQCQKRLRLTEGRRLMLDENKNVTQAAAEVGYESLSQFIRDYRRMFGAAPKEDIRAIGRRAKEKE